MQEGQRQLFPASKHDPLIRAFATFLRRRREALDLSQEALARRAGISTVFVGRVESLRNQPTINSMQKLAKGLDARLSDLIREAEALARQARRDQ